MFIYLLISQRIFIHIILTAGLSQAYVRWGGSLLFRWGNQDLREYFATADLGLCTRDLSSDLTVMFPCPATTSMEKLWRPRRECSSFLVALYQERGCHLGGPDSVWLEEAFWDESNQTKNAWGRGVEDYSFLPLKNGRTFPLWNDLMSLILDREINQRPKSSPGTPFSMKERGFRELGKHLQPTKEARFPWNSLPSLHLSPPRDQSPSLERHCCWHSVKVTSLDLNNGEKETWQKGLYDPHIWWHMV